MIVKVIKTDCLTAGREEANQLSPNHVVGTNSRNYTSKLEKIHRTTRMYSHPVDHGLQPPCETITTGLAGGVQQRSKGIAGKKSELLNLIGT